MSGRLEPRRIVPGLKLTPIQWRVLKIVAQGQSPYSDVYATGARSSSRTNTLASLKRRGLIEDSGVYGRRWRLTPAGENATALLYIPGVT